MHKTKFVTTWLRLILTGGALIGLMGVNWAVTATGQQARQVLALGDGRTALGLGGLWNTNQADESTAVEVAYPVAFGSVSLKDAAAAAQNQNASVAPFLEEEEPFPFAFKGATPFVPDAALQPSINPASVMPSTIANFYGLWSGDNSVSLSPPDTNGDIGYDPATGDRYYMQWVNVVLQAWDVTDPANPLSIVPVTAGNTLWAGGLPGSFCGTHNNGDPIVLFDEQAQRWLIGQFAFNSGGPYHQCLAVSQTPNPSGNWWVWDYLYSNTELNDYPHFGVWPDATYNAYFMSVHEFTGNTYSGQGVVAFERAKMLAGLASPGMIRFDLFGVNPDFYGLLPADLDGSPPSSGTPGFFFSVTDSSWIGPSDAMRVWEFRPNWTTPANSTFGVNSQPNYTLTVTGFNLPPCMSVSPYNSCVPQPGTSNRLDSLGGTLMYRAALRSFSTYQTVLLNHTVWADGSDRLGVRWYEVRRTPGTGVWALYQQGTYAPTDGLYRWMGSMAMDKQGNIALGYSVAGSNLYPSIRYTGRFASDPLNTLPQDEVTLYSGSGSQTSSRRWGDYSMMGINNQDGCTFWYTQEFYFSTWDTRVGAFKFPSCNPSYKTYAPYTRR